VAGYVSTYALMRAFFAEMLPDIPVARWVPANLTFAVPLAVVARFGGSDLRITLDTARVDVDYYASTEDTAEAGGELIRAAMRTQLHGWKFGGAAVGRVETMSAPKLLPWAASNVFRVNSAYQVTTHQYSGVS
jgi:hypothetical protein